MSYIRKGRKAHCRNNSSLMLSEDSQLESNPIKKVLIIFVLYLYALSGKPFPTYK